jgi:hypothetical protein
VFEIINAMLCDGQTEPDRAEVVSEFGLLRQRRQVRILSISHLGFKTANPRQECRFRIILIHEKAESSTGVWFWYDSHDEDTA